MPRPPILKPIDWEAVHQSGLPFAQWLDQGENPDHQARMRALVSELVLSPETRALLAGLSRTVNVVAIAEDWCGDVVRHAPVLEVLAQASKRLSVRYVSREQHPDVFVRFLTNGGEAIPKFVFLSDKWVECGNWGPMPAQHRRLIARGKAAGDVGAARRRVSALYDADPNCEEVVAELVELIVTASCTRP
ncbi:MAG: hypothetical protein PWP23_666 [Candidatus Sumerlaeota bacterium]|nr:hypothetical protein [Candidatus Sumerlaeota bacterium]